MSARLDFTGDLAGAQGETFIRRLWLADEAFAAQDLTGFTAAMKVKADYNDPTALIDLTTENGGIALGLAAGPVPTITTIDGAPTWQASVGGVLITISATAMASLSVAECGRKSPPSAMFVFDFMLYGSGVTTRQWYGQLEVSRSVTLT